MDNNRTDSVVRMFNSSTCVDTNKQEKGICGDVNFPLVPSELAELIDKNLPGSSDFKRINGTDRTAMDNAFYQAVTCSYKGETYEFRCDHAFVMKLNDTDNSWQAGGNLFSKLGHIRDSVYLGTSLELT